MALKAVQSGIFSVSISDQFTDICTYVRVPTTDVEIFWCVWGNDRLTVFDVIDDKSIKVSAELQLNVRALSQSILILKAAAAGRGFIFEENIQCFTYCSYEFNFNNCSLNS